MDSPPSKSAQKKAARAARYAQVKLQRRANEKEAKKLKKRIRAEKRAAGELDQDGAEIHRQRKKPRVIFGGKVVVDLGFDDLMSDKVQNILLCILTLA
jgi:tRNA (guanine9-N1)-methyltransferase